MMMNVNSAPLQMNKSTKEIKFHSPPPSTDLSPFIHRCRDTVSRTQLTRGADLRPPSPVPSSLPVMRESGSAFFIPSEGRGDPVSPCPRRVGCNSIFL